MRKEQQVACQLFVMKGVVQGREISGHGIPFTSHEQGSVILWKKQGIVLAFGRDTLRFVWYQCYQKLVKNKTSLTLT